MLRRFFRLLRLCLPQFAQPFLFRLPLSGKPCRLFFLGAADMGETGFFLGDLLGNAPTLILLLCFQFSEVRLFLGPAFDGLFFRQLPFLLQLCQFGFLFGTGLFLFLAKSTPEEIKSDVLQSLKAGKKPDIRQIEERVRDARWTAKQKGVDQDPEAKRERRAKRERWEAELQKREERELQVLAEALQILSKLDREDLERLVVLMSTNDVTSALWLALEWNLKDRGT